MNISGMGKAGFSAHRFAAVLCSTCTPAAFVHPGEAAHGDLGIIGPEDCLFAFSTSGKTRQVMEMVELSRHLGAHKVVAVTSHQSLTRDLSATSLLTWVKSRGAHAQSNVESMFRAD